MLAMTFMLPPQLLQVSISMLNTRLRRCAQDMVARGSAAIDESFGWLPFLSPLPLPRFAGVTIARCLLLGAKTRGILHIPAVHSRARVCPRLPSGPEMLGSSVLQVLSEPYDDGSQGIIRHGKTIGGDCEYQYRPRTG